MTDFERINQPRVEKILKMLEVIQTSARSNKVSEDEVQALLAPIFGGTTTPVADEPRPAQSNGNGLSHWSKSVEFARNVQIKDAPVIVQILGVRLEEHLS